MTRMDQKMLIDLPETPIPFTYLKTAGGSKNIHSSTTGAAEPNPDIFYYTPSSGYIAKITNFTIGVGDNTVWANVANIGDHTAPLTTAIKVQIRRGNGNIETIAAFTSNLDLIYRQFHECNTDFLYQAWTNDRALFAYLRFYRDSPPILNGTLGDKITVSVFESLAGYAIKQIHAGIMGVSYVIAS